MSATGYTTIYNEVLRDRTLSLEAKGLFAVIKSFVGLPDFALSKRRLGYACSDSAYLLNAAWKELKQRDTCSTISPRRKMVRFVMSTT